MSSIIDSLAKLAEKFSQKYPGEASGVATLDGSGDVVEAVTSIQADAIAATGGTDTHKLMGVIHVDTAQVGNVGAGADDLMTYVLPGGTLDVNGKVLRVKAWGGSSTAGKSVTLIFKFGAGQLALMVSGNDGTWFAECLVARTGGTTQATVLRGEFDGGVSNRVVFAAGSETLSSDITVKFTGENNTDAVDDAVFQLGMIVEILN